MPKNNDLIKRPFETGTSLVEPSGTYHWVLGGSSLQWFF